MHGGLLNVCLSLPRSSEPLVSLSPDPEGQYFYYMSTYICNNRLGGENIIILRIYNYLRIV